MEKSVLSILKLKFSHLKLNLFRAMAPLYYRDANAAILVFKIHKIFNKK